MARRRRVACADGHAHRRARGIRGGALPRGRRAPGREDHGRRPWSPGARRAGDRIRSLRRRAGRDHPPRSRRARAQGFRPARADLPARHRRADQRVPADQDRRPAGEFRAPRGVDSRRRARPRRLRRGAGAEARGGCSRRNACRTRGLPRHRSGEDDRGRAGRASVPTGYTRTASVPFARRSRDHAQERRPRPRRMDRLARTRPCAAGRAQRALASRARRVAARMTPPFGSTLSARGFAALRDAGFRPLRQVQGTSILSLGWQRRPSRWMRGSLSPMMLEGTPGAAGGSAMRMYYPRGSLAVQQYLNEGGWFELEERTAAYNDARQQALKRLREAAAEAGALAVVDVRIRRGKFAQALRATGILGIEVGRERHEASDDDLLVTVDLLGNAIAPIEQGAPPELTYALGLGKA